MVPAALPPAEHLGTTASQLVVIADRRGGLLAEQCMVSTMRWNQILTHRHDTTQYVSVASRTAADDYVLGRFSVCVCV